MRRGDWALCGGSGEHDAADVLGVVIHQVLGTKSGLDKTLINHISSSTHSYLQKFCRAARTGLLLEKSDIELLV